MVSKTTEMNCRTFDMWWNVLRPAVTRENTKLRDCIVAEKSTHLAHRNSNESIGRNVNVGRSTVLEAVQDVVGRPYST